MPSLWTCQCVISSSLHVALVAVRKCTICERIDFPEATQRMKRKTFHFFPSLSQGCSGLNFYFHIFYESICSARNLLFSAFFPSRQVSLEFISFRKKKRKLLSLLRRKHCEGEKIASLAFSVFTVLGGGRFFGNLMATQTKRRKIAT